MEIHTPHVQLPQLGPTIANFKTYYQEQEEQPESAVFKTARQQTYHELDSLVKRTGTVIKKGFYRDSMCLTHESDDVLFEIGEGTEVPLIIRSYEAKDDDDEYTVVRIETADPNYSEDYERELFAFSDKWARDFEGPIRDDETGNAKLQLVRDIAHAFSKAFEQEDYRVQKRANEAKMKRSLRNFFIAGSPQSFVWDVDKLQEPRLLGRHITS